MNEIEAFNKAHFGALFDLIGQLRNEQTSIEGFRTKVGLLDDEYHSAMPQLLKTAQEQSGWMKPCK